jgi:hypothetical protein
MKRYELTDVSTRDYYPKHELIEDRDGDWVKYADVLIAVAAIDRALRVPAAEYVPAISDAFALIDEHFGDAISPHHRTRNDELDTLRAEVERLSRIASTATCPVPSQLDYRGDAISVGRIENRG